MKHRIGPRHPDYDIVLTNILHLFEAWSGFALSLMGALCLLYIIGNLQSFTLETQSMVLSIMQIVGFSAVGINAYSLLMIVLWGVRHRQFPALRFGLSLLGFLVVLALAIAVSLISMFLRPVW